MLEVISVVIVGIALAVSVIVYVDNRIREARAARLARKPALVFAWHGERRTWTLSNIGSGPALDVVIFQRINGKWMHPLRMPEMAVQDDHTVPRRWYEYWHESPGLGAGYRSTTGETYNTRTGDDYSEISEGWDEDTAPATAIEPHWRWRSDNSGDAARG